MDRKRDPPRSRRIQSRSVENWVILGALVALALVFLMALTSCAGAGERAREVELGRAAGDAVGAIAEDPSVTTAVTEFGSLATKLFYTLTGLGGVGTAGLLARNHLSNKRKSLTEERVTKLEANMDGLTQNVANVVTARMASQAQRE